MYMVCVCMVYMCVCVYRVRMCVYSVYVCIYVLWCVYVCVCVWCFFHFSFRISNLVGVLGPVLGKGSLTGGRYSECQLLTIRKDLAMGMTMNGCR